MRILFVALANSIHTCRWITQLNEQGWDIHLFNVNDHPPHPRLRNVTLHEFLTPRSYDIDQNVEVVGRWPLPRGSNLTRRLVGTIAPQWLDRSWRLARLIRKLRPNIVHSLGIQHGGYLTLSAREHFPDGSFPTWALSNWGSDLSLFGRLAAHEERIRAVLAACDYYHCECLRDVDLAQAFGYKGEVLPLFPVNGGFDLAQIRKWRQPGPTSSRRCLVLKGYQNWAGRALVALRAVELCKELLEGYRVVIPLAGSDVQLAGELLSQKTGIPIECDTGGWTHDDILRFHGTARVSIGLSISDGISTSLLEAMIMGSFPIQSHTGCGNEWISEGENGLMVHPESPEEVAGALKRALTDDTMVDRAAEINDHLATERLDKSVIEPQTTEIYKTIAGPGTRRETTALSTPAH